MDERYPDFPHHTEIHGFLREYTEKFGLHERIRFGAAVRQASRLDGGGWDIDGEQFDVLLVCNGHHWDPSYPKSPVASKGRRSTPTTTSIPPSRWRFRESVCSSSGYFGITQATLRVEMNTVALYDS